MHYYQFNIGDYATHTRFLNLMEDLVYRRLLDLCYLTEKSIDLDINKLARLIGMPEHKEEIKQVLTDFFIETKTGYEQKRINEEIDKYHSKADSARANGKLGGRPKKPKITQSVNLANPAITQPKAKKSESQANQEPITKNQEPIKKTKAKKTGFIKPTLDEVNNFAVDSSFNLSGFFDYYESNGWRVGKNSMKDWQASARGWSRRGHEKHNGYSKRKSIAETHHDTLKQIAREADEREMGQRVVQ